MCSLTDYDEVVNENKSEFLYVLPDLDAQFISSLTPLLQET